MKKYILIAMLSVAIAQNTNQEIITFESANPFSFEEIIVHLDCLLYTSPSPRD